MLTQEAIKTGTTVRLLVDIVGVPADTHGRIRSVNAWGF